MVGIVDPAAEAELETEYRREREHLISERDGKIDKIRAGAQG